ncbi:MAG: 16S rRNA (adenine(1518)-N(6)/adenine(1519)-N(6))-dimethyltransferase RsmA [Spirochaetia bacterium]|nr:16S rRNA (adenine(1518)-N(6)/adenine(1519)-N(6))-dimethyltransferase RsmA [Spirochaetia bacterium]
MNKRDITGIAGSYGLAPNKRLGQNFLADDGIASKIISVISPSLDDDIIEVGPGLGALTEPLSRGCRSLTAVEIDSGLCRYLTERFAGYKNVRIEHADFLKYSAPDLYTKAVSNLPYYCASSILFKMALALKKAGLYVMLQKEMAERISAPPGGKEYGALTVTLAYYYNAKIAFNVPREVFYPRPDVASAFVKLERREETLSAAENILFHTIVKSSFWGRRKTIFRALVSSPHLSFDKDQIRNALELAGIDEKTRGEEYGVDKYCLLARLLAAGTNGKD